MRSTYFLFGLETSKTESATDWWDPYVSFCVVFFFFLISPSGIARFVAMVVHCLNFFNRYKFNLSVYKYMNYKIQLREKGHIEFIK